MKPAATSFPLPETLEPGLARILAAWKGLLRGEADMPFSDDIDLAHLPQDADHAFLVAVFQNPERFRFEAAGDRIAQRYGAALDGAFADEIEPRPPLESFTDQCRATVAQRAPTFYRPPPSGAARPAYGRLILPAWGDGHVSLLLGAVVEAEG